MYDNKIYDRKTIDREIGMKIYFLSTSGLNEACNLHIHNSVHFALQYENIFVLNRIAFKWNFFFELFSHFFLPYYFYYECITWPWIAHSTIIL